MSINLKKFFYAFIALIILCTSLGYLIIEYLKFPNKISLIEGNSNKIEYKLPLKATIECDDEIISCLKVNNKLISGGGSIFNIKEIETIESEKSGKATMTLSAFGLPVKKVAIDILPDIEVIPCGVTASVKINTSGVMVLGTQSVDGDDGKKYNPSDGILKSGDLIIEANKENLQNKEQFGKIIKDSKEDIEVKVKREDSEFTAKIKPVLGKDDKENKIGVWVRDGTCGIGTITYYNPSTNRFAALGHGILDVDTKQILNVKNGELKLADISTVVKGKKGAPGELIGETKGSPVIGHVEHNSPYGIYGSMDISSITKMPSKKYKIGLSDKVHEGPATIFSTVNGTKVEEYDIFIETVNRNNLEDGKGMVIRITDPKLLSRTNGIVQGMSGSPIIQDGKIIGAVTHVFVQDPYKGYGIFIENMLKYEYSL